MSECGRKIRNANRMPKSDDRTESNLRRGRREGGKMGGRQGGGEEERGGGGRGGERGGEGRGGEGRGGEGARQGIRRSKENYLEIGTRSLLRTACS